MSDDLFRVAIQAITEGFDKANSELGKLNKNLEQTEKSGKRSQRGSETAAKSTEKLTRATRGATSAQQRARQQFLATANSVAVLDGPLGGVASRFSAFGVLIGRIGIPLAGLAIGFSALTFAAQRAIREFAEWEKSLSTIENRLNATGNQINLTTQEIVNMSEQLALSTLANEKDVLAAANSLLTFRNITTDIFEDVLKSAQDLAASGFGTIESEALRMAKALEDPRQGLTSLSRAGITFTRQQRQLIISLIDGGRQAEAYRILMEGVERQVGGAGTAQANETLAGSFDSIGQGVRTLTRDLGELIVNTGPLTTARVTLQGLAEAYIEFSREVSEAERISNALNRLDQFGDSVNDVQSGIRAANDAIEEFGLSIETLTQGQMRNDLDLGVFHIQEVVDALKKRNHQLEIEKDLREAMATLERRSTDLTDLQAQIDMQRELIGLTEEEARVQRILADLGFGARANIRAEMEAAATAIERMSAAGEDVTALKERFAELEEELAEVDATAKELRQVFEDQRIAREINRLEESSANTNAVLRRQVEILEEARAVGNDALTLTEARRQAELETEMQMVRTQKATAAAAFVAALLAKNFVEAAKAAAEVARLTLIINNLEDNADLQLRLGDLGRTSTSGGGGGGGTDPNAQYQRELEDLQSYLEQRREEMMIAAGFERELVIEQYEERFQILQEALNRGLIQKEQFYEMEIALAQSKEDRITEIEREAHNERLMLTSNIFGNLSSMAQAFGERQSRTAAIFGGIQATIASYVAATEAMAQTPGDFLTKLSAYSSVLATGMGAVAAISRAGGGSGGGGGASGRTAAAPREAREAAPQRVLIQGLDPNAFYTGEQLQNLFEAFYEENSNRGKIFVVSQ